MPGWRWLVAVLLVLLAVRLVDPAPVEVLRLRGFDLMQRLAPRAYRDLPVRIVTVDEASLARYGQWPWSRVLVAQLVDRIAAGGPAAMPVDILFVEPDRLSPPRLAETVGGLPAEIAAELSRLPGNDAVLAASLRKLPTVLGLGVSNEADPATHGPLRSSPVAVTGEDPKPFLPRFAALVASLPELRAAERGRGVLAGLPDADGIVRRVSLFAVAEDKILPSMSAEAVRVAMGGNLRIAADRLGIAGVAIAGKQPPVDSRGRAYLHFTPPLAARYIPAGDLLSGKADPARLRGSIVFLGLTGLGLVDVKQTPLGLMDGVEVQAQLVESIIDDRLLRRDSRFDAAEFLLVLLGGVACLLLPYRRPRLAGVVLAGLVAALWIAEVAAFRLGALLDGVYPALTMLAGFGVMLGANLRATEAARRRLAEDLQREREAKARIEGEIATASKIQMGLLPRQFPGPPEWRNIETFALIEPARTVGGDLYDLLLLDDRRLFFLIADVTGKGVSAALFMAMCKEVLRSAAFRHGEELDQAFAEANAKVSTASNDIMGEGANMMFVTACACVLDLETGFVVHASAGHDPPFSLRAGASPVALTSVGGPPLGAVDDFPFTVDSHQMVPGEMLVLYTDGVTEAEDVTRSFYTVDRLERVLRYASLDSARGTIDLVRADVRRFVGPAEQADDITMLAVRWTGP